MRNRRGAAPERPQRRRRRPAALAGPGSKEAGETRPARPCARLGRLRRGNARHRECRAASGPLPPRNAGKPPSGRWTRRTHPPPLARQPLPCAPVSAGGPPARPHARRCRKNRPCGPAPPRRRIWTGPAGGTAGATTPAAGTPGATGDAGPATAHRQSLTPAAPLPAGCAGAAAPAGTAGEAVPLPAATLTISDRTALAGGNRRSPAGGDSCPVRRALDEAAAQAIGLAPAEVADWRRRLAAEPTITGETERIPARGKECDNDDGDNRGE